MILFGKFIQLFAKISALLILLSFEFSLGLPVLYLTFATALIITARPVSKYLLVTSSIWMLAVVFDLSIYLSFFSIVSMYFGFKYLSSILESNLKRFYLLLLVNIALIYTAVGIDLTFGVIGYFLLSNVITGYFLVKILFKKYGFLGTKLQAKHSFLR